MHDVGILNATIVSEEGERGADLYVGEGTVRAIVDPGRTLEARETIDARGLFVLPGLVDGHVHFREPGLAHKEGVLNGSRAAAAGGVTTTIIMATDDPMTAGPEEFEQKIAIGRQSHVDFAINAIVGSDVGKVPALADAGCCVFDLFLGDVPDTFLIPDAARLVNVLAAIARVGGVAGVTPALQPLTAESTARLIAAGRRTIFDFAASRPPVTESIGVAMACEAACATRCRIHLRQTSCRESVDIIRYYKRRAPGLISAETLPHNLVLDESHLATFGPYAKMSPPLRDRSHASALWDGLRDGTIDIIATDHAPHLPAEKEAGRDDIWKAGSGIPGLETFLPSLLREWNEGRVTLSEIARWTSAAPARLFGLQLRKGHLGEGADADLVMIDPSGRRTIDAAAMVTRARYTPFDGLGWNGAIKRVLLRGRTIALDGEPVGEPGGRFQAPGGKV